MEETAGHIKTDSAPSEQKNLCRYRTDVHGQSDNEWMIKKGLNNSEGIVEMSYSCAIMPRHCPASAQGGENPGTQGGDRQESKNCQETLVACKELKKSP